MTGHEHARIRTNRAQRVRDLAVLVRAARKAGESTTHLLHRIYAYAYRRGYLSAHSRQRRKES